MTLTTFLLARIGESEAAARRRLAVGGHLGPSGGPERADGPVYLRDAADPVRVLAECRVQRELIALAYEATGLDETVDMERETGSRHESGVHYVGDRILRAMASLYEGHPDFEPTWRS
ncbi:DUF6221 family protein [Cellulosimicrobium cellulans]|uniref:DUF6221 family protein n=1 Tax=Cellulosimicrobium cellulans TaxID=1710 RepID=UPI00165268DC|nr:DUF6221 family protein [Cellulosimicrobium cellulans]